jgi:hypothetical protein
MEVVEIEKQEEGIPSQEEFVWRNMTFSIGELLADLAAGSLRPKADRLLPEFIATYATSVLRVRKGVSSGSTFSLLVSAQYERMLRMPEGAYAQPVILAYVGRNKGIVALDGTGPHYVLVDGNHRVGKAYLDGRDGVDVVILSAAQVRKYKH